MMRKETFFSILLGGMLSVTNTGCRDDENSYVQEIEDGGFFLRDNTVRLFYLDERGNDLLDPRDLSSLPQTYHRADRLPNRMSIPTDYKKGVYNQGINSIGFDEKENLFYLQTIVAGDSRQNTYSFYIRHRDRFDKIDMTYKYTTDDVYGWSYWSRIVSWKYNNVHIYSDSDGYDKKVFIKRSGTTTVISFNR